MNDQTRRFKRAGIRGLWLLAFALSCQAQGTTQNAAQSLPTLTLNAGIHLITAELAQTEQQREIGLMFRESMAANHGMLFVFEQVGQQCFWMKNTLLPLDVAFIADNGTVVNTDHMKPRTLDAHCSQKPVRFVLEMNDGWFAKRGIAAGSKLTGQPFTP